MPKAFHAALMTAFALLTALSAVALLRVGAEGASPPTPDSQPTTTGRYIVQLADPPLATYAGGVSGLPATAAAKTGARRLDTSAAASQAYATHLQQEQAKVEAALKTVAPTAVVERRYGVVYNGLAVRMTAADAAKVGTLPDVKAVVADQAYHLLMDHSLPWIGAPQMWAQLGGAEQAGRGVKAAVIDTGIYISNTFFNPVGFSYPSGFPKGEAKYTTPKVIAARAYFRPDDPPAPGHETPLPGLPDVRNPFAPFWHGSHVAGTVAGVADTHATLTGLQADLYGPTHILSGVAPGAWLMNYKVFYQSANSGDAGAYTAELMAAIEDAVVDGADVVSNSWSADHIAAGWTDPIVQAAEAAIDAGVVMVFAAGNSGPGHSSIGSPAVSPRVISVGASTAPLTVTYPLGVINVTAPTPVVSDVVSLQWGPTVLVGPPITRTIGPLPYVWAGAVASDGNPDGCNLDGAPNPFPPGAFSGKIALLQRGTCRAYDKVKNAQEAGAVAAIIYNRQPDDIAQSQCNMGCPDIVIPTVDTEYAAGQSLLTWYLDHPHTAQLEIALGSRAIPIPGDAIAGFSSRGPTPDLRLKPDVVAPGVSINSAGPGEGLGLERYLGFGIASGTSMATPHVAGAAALLRQLHLDWTPDQIKSALMTTAKIEGFSPESSGAISSILDYGAGRIDLTHAGDPGVTLDTPSVGMEVRQGWSGREAIRLTNVARDAESYTVTISPTEQTPTGLVLAVEPRSPSVGPGDSVSLTLRLAVAPDAAAGDHTGILWLRGRSHTAHIPYWMRITPVQPTDVLLLDNDGSSAAPEDAPLADYAHVYTETLARLGVSYTYFDGDAAHLSDRFSLADLLRYKTVIWFTGDAHAQFFGAKSTADQQRLRDYLHSGGRLLATGQDLSHRLADGWTAGSSLLYFGYLGAGYVQDDLFQGPLPLPPRPSIRAADSASFLGAMRLDLSAPVTGTVGAGAGNQRSVDEIAPMTGFATYALGYAHVRPLLTAIGGQPEQDGTVGLALSSEPSLEEPRDAVNYRTAYLSFGLEGINDNTGYATKADVMSKLLSWLADDVTMSVTGPTTATIGTPISLTASGRSSASDATFTRYRWDFGDGTAVQDTLRPSVFHTYARPGTHTVRVEATDSYGHKILAFAKVVALKQASGDQWQLYLPYVSQNISVP